LVSLFLPERVKVARTGPGFAKQLLERKEEKYL